MLQQLANNLSSFFVKKSLITVDEKQIYTYCFEVFLSTIFLWGSIIALAVVTNTIYPTICYMLCFFFFRGVAGGYHAATHFNCYLVSLAAFLVFLVVQVVLPQQLHFMVSCFLTVLSTFIIILLAPVEHENNPFTEQSRKRFRKKSLMVLFIFLLIIIVLFQFHFLKTVFYIVWGCFQAAISVVVAFYLNRRRRIL